MDNGGLGAYAKLATDSINLDRVLQNFSQMTLTNRIRSLSNAPHPLDGHTSSPWKGPVPFSARLRSECGTEACSPFSVVRRERPPCEVLWEGGTLTCSIASPSTRFVNSTGDVSTALAAIREWRNSFVPINRIPLEVLSLIPTHISSQKDRFRSTFVCRRWHRTFLQHGIVHCGPSCTSERARCTSAHKGPRWTYLPVPWMTSAPRCLLLPHIKRIGSLNFADSTRWTFGYSQY